MPSTINFATIPSPPEISRRVDAYFDRLDPAYRSVQSVGRDINYEALMTEEALFGYRQRSEAGKARDEKQLQRAIMAINAYHATTSSSTHSSYSRPSDYLTATPLNEAAASTPVRPGLPGATSEDMRAQARAAREQALRRFLRRGQYVDFYT